MKSVPFSGMERLGTGDADTSGYGSLQAITFSKISKRIIDLYVEKKQIISSDWKTVKIIPLFETKWMM